ncbi:L,D-transpeptidase family protein [Colwelliaceae bacterium 6471]
MNVISLVVILLLQVFIQATANAREYPMPEQGSRLLGEMQYHQVKKGDYFQALAEHYDVGFLALLAANPTVDPFLPDVGQQLTIPSQLILPYVAYQGIVINLPELRLYYFHPDANKVSVFPVGIGRQGLSTPKVLSYIGEKRKDPVWRPPKAMRERYLAENGKPLAMEILPGPDNPFGKYALRIGTSEYLIHGSNQRFGIGMRSSAGCIRMFDEDIAWLYKHVSINTPVRIIDQNVKMSYEKSGQRLIEIHSPLSDEQGNNPGVLITDVIKRFVGESNSRWLQLAPIIKEPTGLVITLD